MISINIDKPKLTCREFRPWDWYGWFMSLVGIGLIAFWGSMDDISWTYKLAMIFTISFFTLDYFWRVVYGRVYSHIYYDTMLYNMYEIAIGNDTYFVCAEDEEELNLYIGIHYPDMEYRIITEHPLESFIKKEHYQ